MGEVVLVRSNYSLLGLMRVETNRVKHPISKEESPPCPRRHLGPGLWKQPKANKLWNLDFSSQGRTQNNLQPGWVPLQQGSCDQLGNQWGELWPWTEKMSMDILALMLTPIRWVFSSEYYCKHTSGELSANSLVTALHTGARHLKPLSSQPCVHGHCLQFPKRKNNNHQTTLQPVHEKNGSNLHHNGGQLLLCIPFTSQWENRKP